MSIRSMLKCMWCRYKCWTWDGMQFHIQDVHHKRPCDYDAWSRGR